MTEGFTLHIGDVSDKLATLLDGSVDCVVTSPPYWGLRDYGTGSWEGGNPDCDHTRHDYGEKSDTNRGSIRGGPMLDVCGKCGARRQDRQLGLEPTPDEYVQNMVAVFREVRRVLADHGTCWVNLGDSYAANGATSQVPQTKQHKGSGVNGPNRGNTGLTSKNLVGIPWRTAFALQADGWYLRSDIVWSKPNPMPESVTDRPTKAHEYVFLLSKRPRYWFDQEAVREPHKPDGRVVMTRTVANGSHGNYQEVGHEEGRERWPGAGRNVRSVWEIATQPYAEAHFATYPEELVRRCLLAGCPEWVCRVCGKPRERIVDVAYDNPGNRTTNGPRSLHREGMSREGFDVRREKRTETVGWSHCGHNDYRPGVVLDPFLGSGTTAVVALRNRRHAVGVELNPTYAALAEKRIGQWWKPPSRPAPKPVEGQETLL